jgi:pyruvate ferredoxin oxidoreductase beta subunit
MTTADRQTRPRRLTLKVLSEREDRLGPGHRLCAGCGAPIVVRQILNAIDEPVVVFNSTGCLEVGTTIYPYTAWRVPWMHSAFENAAATAAGAEAMYRSLVRQGKIEDRKIRFIAFGGDGGTYDIGLQALSGALERGHKFMYVCYDNQGYMNTGIQRSSATPFGAATTTSPSGTVIPGKQQFRKDLTAIAAAHNIPYAAQASPHRWKDLMQKARKGANADGPAFLNVLAPCNRGWRLEDTDDTLDAARMAVETRYWPLFEVENGHWRLTYKPRKELPVIEWLKTEGRFRHLLRGEHQDVINMLQEEVDRRWENLLRLCGEA